MDNFSISVISPSYQITWRAFGNKMERQGRDDKWQDTDGTVTNGIHNDRQQRNIIYTTNTNNYDEGHYYILYKRHLYLYSRNLNTYYFNLCLVSKIHETASIGIAFHVYTLP